VRKAAKGRRRVARIRHRLTAMGSFGINLSATYQPEREQRRDAKSASNEKDGPVRNQVADRAHPGCGETCPDGSESGVAAKPLRHGGMADQPKADRADGRSFAITLRRRPSSATVGA
jgi:hypothetical protein